MTKPVVKFIAREQQNSLIATLSKSNFFSIQADASTDSGNVEVEMYLVLHLDPFSEDGKVHVRSRFFSPRHLSSMTGEDLFKSLKEAVAYMGLEDQWKEKWFWLQWMYLKVV